MQRKYVAVAANAAAVAGVLGLTILSLPAGAGEAPELPRVGPEQLVQSVMTAPKPAFSGTVQVDNDLGIPALPGEGDNPLMSAGKSKVEVWSDGEGRQRLTKPGHNGGTTVVNDGSTVWTWDSAKHTATNSSYTKPKHPGEHHQTDPAAAARDLISKLHETSNVAVDGTAKVAGRDAYELVLTPKPGERTVLREVRVAIDAQKRMPLELTVNTNGSDSPALKIGFSQLDMTKPDAGLFQFTPPAGAKIERPKHEQHQDKPEHAGKAEQPQVLGEGWDTVFVARFPQQAQGQPEPGKNHGKGNVDPRALAQRVGKHVSGPWGEGWVISSKAGSVLLTADGRLAAGAVPEQVLTEAIGHAG